MPSGLPGEVGSLAGHERLDPCDSPSEDQSMDIMSTWTNKCRVSLQSEQLTISLYFFNFASLFWMCHMACGILVPQPGILIP